MKYLLLSLLLISSHAFAGRFTIAYKPNGAKVCLDKDLNKIASMKCCLTGDGHYNTGQACYSKDIQNNVKSGSASIGKGKLTRGKTALKIRSLKLRESNK